MVLNALAIIGFTDEEREGVHVRSDIGFRSIAADTSKRQGDLVTTTNSHSKLCPSSITWKEKLHKSYRVTVVLRVKPSADLGTGV